MQPGQIIALIVLAQASPIRSQGFGGYGGGNPYSGSGGGDNNNPFDPNSSSDGSGFTFGGFNFSHDATIVTAHAVMATLAFALFFPIGGIIVRLCPYRHTWIVHALFQLFAYLLYTAAFGLGVWMISQRNQLLNNAHPIIGILLFILLSFQPLLGFLHHLRFRKTSKRSRPSHLHIWLGRIVVTVGIINGGLGLRLARQLPLARPSSGAIIVYGIVAGIIWLVYVVSAVIGERRRRGRSGTVRKEEEGGE